MDAHTTTNQIVEDTQYSNRNKCSFLTLLLIEIFVSVYVHLPIAITLKKCVSSNLPFFHTLPAVYKVQQVKTIRVHRKYYCMSIHTFDWQNGFFAVNCAH